VEKGIMATTTDKRMGKVTTTITVANRIDQILAQRGFIPVEQIRSITLKDVLVDTGATRLCLPENIISDLGLVLQGEVDVKIAVGVQKVRTFRELSLVVEGREGTFNCIELPAGSDPLLGLIPLEDLGLEPDLQNQRLRLLPMEGKDTYLTVL
jgi:predicted aspartyl protease